MFSNSVNIYILLFLSDSSVFPHNYPFHQSVVLDREVFEDRALVRESLEGESLECKKSLEF